MLGALACPQDPPGIAWIRLFLCATPLAEAEVWPPLWEAARETIALQGGVLVAAISMQPWFEEMLLHSGFRFHQEIIMLDWQDAPVKPHDPQNGVSLRLMRPADLPAVVGVDASAFEPLWQNSFDAFKKAYAQALYATVAETSDGLIGYQLSTGNPLGAHLARLAVRPESQGSGVGAALVGDLILHLKERGRPHITVNTQGDNPASQALYKKMGFMLTGERYPVLVYQV
jgi:ribosomal protein S18 acetylase RimI-like enzyme